MEKRVYLEGYYKEKPSNVNNKSATANKIIGKKNLPFESERAKEGMLQVVEQPTPVTDIADELMASTGSETSILTQSPMSKLKPKLIGDELLNPTELLKTDKITKKSIKSVIKKFGLTADPEIDSSSVVKLVGIVLMSLSLIIFLFIHWIIGALGAIIGLILFLGGLFGGNKNSSVRSTNNTTQYEDVVYLNSGGIVRGTIIEQIPNESIKIQTRDRNVFVFKIDEITKFTKELKK